MSKIEQGKTDFNRNLCLVLGLPFDVIDLEGTIKKIIQAVEKKEKLFLSTPNLNFLIASQKQENFRESVLNSDLSIADGMPIILISKLLGLPLTERVTGSGLIESLQENEECRKKPLKVFFFGGEEGVAVKAHDVLNRKKGGLKSVGFLNPGFGSVTEMSHAAIIDEINAKNPDFIIVSLGAEKGQGWITHNITRLNAPVISHLGAVVNFTAGNIVRAPRIIQKMHLEWLWRIKEEPALFKRYWNDGCGFLTLLIKDVLPYRSWLKKNPILKDEKGGGRLTLKEGNEIEVGLFGQLSHHNLNDLKLLFDEIMLLKRSVVFNMADVTKVDSAFLASLLLLRKDLGLKGFNISFTELKPSLKRVFLWNKLGFLLGTLG